MSNKNPATLVGGKYFLYGLDISLNNTGVAIFDLETREFVHISSFNTENIKATKEYKGLEISALKIHKIREWFENLIKEFPPYYLAIEQMVKVEREHGVNINEIKGIAKATGVIQEAVWNKPQTFYYPSTVKSAIIKGSASKEVVRSEILKRYPHLVFKNLDESDATAVALTKLIEVGIVQWEKPVEVKTPKTRRKAK